MKNSLVRLFFLGSLCLTSCVYGQSSLKEWADQAWSFYESQHLQSLKHQQAKVLYQQAVDTAFFPYISANGSQKFQDASVTGTGVSSSLTNGSIPEYRLSVKQALFGGLRDLDRLSGLEANVRKEEAALVEAKYTLVNQVIQAYFAVLQLQKDASYLKSVCQVARSRLQELQRREVIGRSRRSEVQSAKAQLASYQAQLEQSSTQLSAARLTLQQLAGPAEQQTVNDELYTRQITPKPIDEFPSLRVLNASLESQRAALKESQHAGMPFINMAGNYYLKRSEALDPIKWDVTLTGEWPLFALGFASAEKANSLAVDQLKLMVVQEKRRLQLMLRTDQTLWEGALAQKKQLDEAYVQAKASYEGYEADYRRGLSTQLEVLQSLNAMVEIKKNLDRADVLVQTLAAQWALDSQLSL